MVSNPLYLGACEGMGFPNLPAPGSGSSGDGLKIAAGDAIKISSITISDIRYSRIGVKTDDETITVDSVTNKLKSLVKGLKDYSTSEVATGEHWTDGKMIYRRVIQFDEELTIKFNAYTISNIDSSGIDTVIDAKAYHADGTFYGSIIADPSKDSHAHLGLQSTNNGFDITASKIVLYYTKTV